MADSQLTMSRLTAFFPIAGWLKTYTREDFNSDLLAGIITAILLVPQGIAYAILAGLPPELGLYASILPPALYALLGTSRTLSVGPAAVAAIMIASALNAPEVSALGKPVQSALILSAESGLIMLLMALLRYGRIGEFYQSSGFEGLYQWRLTLDYSESITAHVRFEKSNVWLGCGLLQSVCSRV